jgi:integrase
VLSGDGLFGEQMRGNFAEVPDDAEPGENLQRVIGDVDLPPEEALARRSHELMMIVVPAFAEREQRQQPTRKIILLATMTGLWIGEILALRWGRIVLLRGTLLVAETCYKAHFGTPKTRASKREVPLAPVVVCGLKGHYSRSVDHSPSALVFATIQGAPLAADNLRKKSLRTACKRAGLHRIDWHTLRHTRGTRLHSQGTPLKVAQAQPGHSHMATTLEVYTHACASAQRDAVNLLEDQLFPSWSEVKILRRKKVSWFSALMVGASGFEPETSCAQGRRATRLRYAPT